MVRTAAGSTAGHRIGVGDVIISRRNDVTVEVYDGADVTKVAAPVRNGNRWQVYRVDPDNQRVAARRLGDNARALFAGGLPQRACPSRVRRHRARRPGRHRGQHARRVGRVCDPGRGVRRDDPRPHRQQCVSVREDWWEGDHEHAETEAGVHHARRGTSSEAAALLRTVLGRDDRAQTVMATAADVDRTLLPEQVRDLLDAHDRTKAGCRTAYRRHLTSQTVERELAAVLPGLRAAVRLLEVAGGGRSGAGMYTTTAAVLTGIDDETRRHVVRAVAQDVHACRS